jgi:hypothetical protein
LDEGSRAPKNACPRLSSTSCSFVDRTSKLSTKHRKDTALDLRKKIQHIPLFSSPGLSFRPGELLSSLFVRRPSSVVRPSTFHILIFSSETTGPIATKLWWNGPWMAPFQKFARWSRLPTKMAAKLKIEKRGDEILIVHCCFSVSQNELKF